MASVNSKEISQKTSEDRLAARLRDNLHRRKAKIRAQAQHTDDTVESKNHDG